MRMVENSTDWHQPGQKLELLHNGGSSSYLHFLLTQWVRLRPSEPTKEAIQGHGTSKNHLVSTYYRLSNPP